MITMLICKVFRYFVDQPLTHPDVTDKHVLAWYFEDWLKKFFYSILQILEVSFHTQDTNKWCLITKFHY